MLTLKKRIQAFETKSMRKLLHMSYLEHKTDDWAKSKIITNSTNNISADTSMNGQKLEELQVPGSSPEQG